MRGRGLLSRRRCCLGRLVFEGGLGFLGSLLIVLLLRETHSERDSEERVGLLKHFPEPLALEQRQQRENPQLDRRYPAHFDHVLRGALSDRRRGRGRHDRFATARNTIVIM